jgi:hypothetical protein
LGEELYDLRKDLLSEDCFLEVNLFEVNTIDARSSEGVGELSILDVLLDHLNKSLSLSRSLVFESKCDEEEGEENSDVDDKEVGGEVRGEGGSEPAEALGEGRLDDIIDELYFIPLHSESLT